VAVEEHGVREVVAGDVVRRNGVPAEVLDRDPGLVPHGLETDVHLGLLIGCEGGLSPAEDEAARRLPDFDSSNLEAPA